MSDWQHLKEEWLDDPEFSAYCEERRVDLDVANALTRQRFERNLTQADLARLSGVSQADISRYENMDKLPSLKTLMKLAEALGCTLRVEFVPKASPQ